MKHSYKTTFDALYAHRPSADLADRIETRILKIEAQRSRRKAYSFGALALVALVALVPAIQYAFSQIAQSGFYEYVSLFVSDSGYVFTHLREKVLHNLHTLHRTARSLRFSSVYSTDPHAQKIQAPTRSPSNHLSYLYHIISP
jgi:hypothetical protein